MPLGELHDEVLREQRDVVLPLPEGRKLNRDDVQTIEKVFAERALADCVLWVAVRRGQHAHVNRNFVRAAEASNLSVFEYAQQLRLKREGHLGDFVQEERAAVRKLEAAEPTRGCSGESAALVAINSDSISVSGMAEQLIATKAVLRRGLRL